jgi:two-component system, sensor histidine kinase PdtaS
MPDRHPVVQRLGFRLAFALALALLPLGLLSAYQVRSLMSEAQARSEAAILGETLLAIAPDAGLIRDGRTAAAAMAVPLAAIDLDPALCSDLMRKLIEQTSTAYSFAAFVPVDGQVVCSSNGQTLDLSDSPRLAAMLIAPKADVAVIRNGQASGTSVLAFGHPVFDTTGKFIGYVSLSMPHTVLESATPSDWTVKQIGGDVPVSLITFDLAGNILTSSTGLDNAPQDLPADRTLVDLAQTALGTFSAFSVDGQTRVYAVAPIIEGTLFTLGSWPATEMRATTALFLSPYLPTVLMWVVTLMVAILAAERLVARHIRVLRRSITAFARGGRTYSDVELPGAAAEIRDVADAFLKMTDTILRDEAELVDMVHQREVLLREVHHRVKNNLQLIASIMNMQMRQARSPETRTLMKNLQDRVMSLATIHRELYQTSGLTDVRADELLAHIVRQILNMASGPGRLFDLVNDFDLLHLTPDQAVPLSLLLTEALTNAIKYAGIDRDVAGPSAVPRLNISLKRQGDIRAVLSVVNSVATTAPPRSPEEGSGLGSQLIAAFAKQLAAEIQTEVKDGTYRLTVAFDITPLGRAEADTETAA